ncbi:putative necrosis-inducing factor-domain-containing protein [Sordaria brevicollis]|uniref:Necrosis-inducing factor-domain-containing protein n=1 Tax=Sordaria brevicollis TaxID=83679 RepID=A0AAE0U2Y0_SORBR|nr:putative necrosis-inducing factor-domain-containing protein [Sordaria brevicollis]
MHLVVMFAGAILAMVSTALSIPTAVSGPALFPQSNSTVTSHTTSSQHNALVIKCEESVWMTDKTTRQSPLVEDCRHLQRNIAKDGEWRTMSSRHRNLATYGTCVFDVRGFDGLDIFKVGNDDIIDRIDEAVAEFAKQDEDGNYRVGAEGEFWCDSLMSWRSGVTWTIEHSDNGF